MLGSKLKIATLVGSVCLVLLLGNYGGCSAKQNGAVFDDTAFDNVNWTDLDPIEASPAPSLKSQKRKPAGKNNQRDNDFDDDYEEADRPSGRADDYDDGDNDPYSTIEDEQGLQLLKRHHDLLEDYVKMLNKNLTKALDGIQGSGNLSPPATKLSNNRDLFKVLPIISGVATRAICLIEAVLGLGRKPREEWIKKCCPFLLLRIIAPVTCRDFNKIAPSTPRPTTPAPKTTTTAKPNPTKPSSTEFPDEYPTTAAPISTTSAPSPKPDAYKLRGGKHSEEKRKKKQEEKERKEREKKEKKEKEKKEKEEKKKKEREEKEEKKKKKKMEEEEKKKKKKMEEEEKKKKKIEEEKKKKENIEEEKKKKEKVEEEKKKKEKVEEEKEATTEKPSTRLEAWKRKKEEDSEGQFDDSDD